MVTCGIRSREAKQQGAVRFGGSLSCFVIFLIGCRAQILRVLVLTDNYFL